jgi:GWxTD domain-containing protein
MGSSSTPSDNGGHRCDGPRCFPLLLILFAVVTGCGGGSRGGERPAPSTGVTLSRPLEIYRDLGFLAGPGQFPVVASFATIAGPADSTYVIVGMSIPNSALRFQRDADGFFAEYTVELVFMDTDSRPVQRSHTRETVRIATFNETARPDESVVFQHGVALQPGRYTVALRAADANSSRGFSMTDTLSAPAYGQHGARLASPMLVYEATGRTRRDEPPGLIINPRHTVPFGGAVPLLYLEAYGSDTTFDIAVLNEAGAAVWSTQAPITNDTGDVRYAVVPIPAESLPLGRFWIEVRHDGAAPQRSPLVVTISDLWMVANFEEVLQFLRYIAHADEMEELRTGTAAERRAAWDAFWERRHPLPKTPLNEYREMFFQRVRYATDAFREPGRAGWQTHRGEVFIVLGPPDHIIERHIGRTEVTGRPNAEEWLYSATPGGRLNLLFHDRSGIGQLELIPASRASFRSAAERIKPRRPHSTSRRLQSTSRRSHSPSRRLQSTSRRSHSPSPRPTTDV